MSDLANVSAEIAPYLALAANSLGTAVITQAQQRIAEGTVAAGEGFFRRLLHRDGAGDLGDGTAQPLLDTRRADALDERLAGLGEQDRQLLSDAVTAWLRAPADRRDAPHLLEHIAQRAPATSTQITHNNHATATGQGSIAANKIEGTINVGGGSGTQDSS
ncbi:hypothetical protein AB0D04_10740 [Streptomyces sp. NPDC048483]|uniref:hypothetical protein n=1 Tax=Streptomyces sp. NPDC048483 TaxID=3154927 RepID=UPI003433BC6F